MHIIMYYNVYNAMMLKITYDVIFNIIAVCPW